MPGVRSYSDGGYQPEWSDDTEFTIGCAIRIAR